MLNILKIGILIMGQLFVQPKPNTLSPEKERMVRARFIEKLFLTYKYNQALKEYGLSSKSDLTQQDVKRIRDIQHKKDKP